MKKKLIVLMIILLYCNTSRSQDVKTNHPIPDNYDRISITLLSLDFPNEPHSREVKDKLNNIVGYHKFYDNDISYKIIPAPYNHQYTGDNKDELIKAELERRNTVREIISKWYSRKMDGTMSMELIHKRGEFNASDAAVIQAEAAKRGNAILRDYGSTLVNLSNILVMDFQDVKNASELKISVPAKGWSANATGYLYKIDFDETVQNQLYDSWIYENDSPQVKEQKRKKFEQIRFPFHLVTITNKKCNEFVTGAMMNYVSDDALLDQLLQGGFSSSLGEVESRYENFKIKASIYQIRPIRAKIGSKEGINTDDRYFVYRYAFDEKSKTTKLEFRGVVRATTKIGNNNKNADGHSPTTKFYQTAGRRLKPGYILQQQGKAALEVIAGYESGEAGGIYGQLNVRLGGMFKVTSFYAFMEAGADTRDYNVLGTMQKGIVFTRYGFGLAKGFMITKNAEFRPYASFGFEFASHDQWANPQMEGGMKVLYIKGGANLAINIRHNLQLMLGSGYCNFMGNPTNKDGTEFKERWSEIFPGREGGVIFSGIKFVF